MRRGERKSGWVGAEVRKWRVEDLSGSLPELFYPSEAFVLRELKGVHSAAASCLPVFVSLNLLLSLSLSRARRSACLVPPPSFPPTPPCFSCAGVGVCFCAAHQLFGSVWVSAVCAACQLFGRAQVSAVCAAHQLLGKVWVSVVCAASSSAGCGCL